MNQKRQSVWIPKDLADKVQTEAEKTDRKIGEMVTHIIKKWFKRKKTCQ